MALVGAAFSMPKALAIVQTELGKLPRQKFVSGNNAFCTSMVGHGTLIIHGMNAVVIGYSAQDLYGNPVSLKIRQVDLNKVEVSVDSSIFRRLFPMAYAVTLISRKDDHDHLPGYRQSIQTHSPVDSLTRRKMAAKIERSLKA
jgi:hypothetical protein